MINKKRFLYSLSDFAGGAFIIRTYSKFKTAGELARFRSLSLIDSANLS
jgi:hypothetical protein